MVPAGYDPAWISFDEAVERVMRAAASGQHDAIAGVVAACKDSAVASRYGDTHEAIDPASWGRAGIVEGYRAEARTYALIAIVPRPGEIPLPREALGPTSPGDGVPRVDRAWSFRPVELRREDVERWWPLLPALEPVEAAPAAEGGRRHGSSTTSQEAGNIISLHTGLPGKPSSWHLIEAECRRRYQAGERHEKTAEWARQLRAWIMSQHPGMPPPTEKTIANRLPELLRELRSNPKS